MARLRVQHCVLALTVRQYGQPRTSDVLGINPFYTVPADTEFPRDNVQLELFLRFFGMDLKPDTAVDVIVGRVDTDIGRAVGRLLYRKRFSVTDTAEPGYVVIDRGYKIIYLRLPSEGEYAVQISRPARSKWGGRYTRVLATERFWVRRAS